MHISNLRVASNSQKQLFSILAYTKDMNYDGENVRLDKMVRSTISDLWKPIVSQERDEILYHLSSVLHIKYLISFDGFDTTRIEHFLFHEVPPTPIHYLIKLLKGLHEKTLLTDLYSRHLEVHYLAYLRDTTFERLRSELFRASGGELDYLDYLRYWIVPPQYRLLVRNAARYVTQSDNQNVTLEDTLATDIIYSFGRTVFTHTALSVADQLPFVFGCNARRMKTHIKQSLLSALHYASTVSTLEFMNPKGGGGSQVCVEKIDGTT